MLFTVTGFLLGVFTLEGATFWDIGFNFGIFSFRRFFLTLGRVAGRSSFFTLGSVLGFAFAVFVSSQKISAISYIASICLSPGMLY